jgi:protease I
MKDSWPYCSLWQATQLAAYQCCQEEKNMSHDLTSIKVAILVAEGFRQDDVLQSQEFLHRSGATMTMVSAATKNLSETGKTGEPPTSITLDGADETGFDALLLPGGQASADNLSRNQAAIDFVRSFLNDSKPIGAIADGIKVLVATNGIAGRRIAAAAALRDQIQKAGGVWVDEAVATDRYLVTAADSRALELFCEAFARACFEHKASSGASLHTD